MCRWSQPLRVLGSTIAIIQIRNIELRNKIKTKIIILTHIFIYYFLTIVLRQVLRPCFPVAAVQGRYSAIPLEHLEGANLSALYCLNFTTSCNILCNPNIRIIKNLNS